MKFRLAMTGSALVVLLCAGCFKTEVVMGSEEGIPASAAYERSHHGGVFGLAEFSEPIRLDTACPNGVARVRQSTTFVNGLLAGFTFGLYTPQTYTVFCKSK